MVPRRAACRGGKVHPAYAFAVYSVAPCRACAQNRKWRGLARAARAPFLSRAISPSPIDCSSDALYMLHVSARKSAQRVRAL